MHERWPLNHSVIVCIDDMSGNVLCICALMQTGNSHKLGWRKREKKPSMNCIYPKSNRNSVQLLDGKWGRRFERKGRKRIRSTLIRPVYNEVVAIATKWTHDKSCVGCFDDYFLYSCFKMNYYLYFVASTSGLANVAGALWRLTPKILPNICTKNYIRERIQLQFLFLYAMVDGGWCKGCKKNC